MSQKLPKIIAVAGPTASGKSTLALALARRFKGEIINADSRQVYRGMDIATDKLISKEVPHHCFDLVDPDQNFSVAEYKLAAETAIAAALNRGCLPILVGGTGLYLKALVENLSLPAVPPDPELRTILESLTTLELLARLEKFDPETARQIDRKNRRRLVRALEVVLKTGWSFKKSSAVKPRKFQVLTLAPKVEFSDLETRWKNRIQTQIAEGLIEETEKLRLAYDPALPSMSSLGYSEMGKYLAGELSLDEAKELLLIHTRQYAKRQLTWFKRVKEIQWVADQAEAAVLTEDFLKNV
ncbi:MAG: tRNA (adenosine(37)-N6)-dimethylallyltransferase MiaA [bacterium]